MPETLPRSRPVHRGVVFVAGLALAGLTLSGCEPIEDSGAVAARDPDVTQAADATLPAIAAPRPGPPAVVSAGPRGAGSAVALTIDDGFCDECVSGYVDLAEHGLHITFCPNGTYGAIWNRYAARIKALLARGTIQICNHTYSHKNLRDLPDREVIEEITRNEQWIEQTFGVTSRPWLRPPFGAHDSRVDALAGRLGFTRILMWNGSFGDSGPLEPDVLLHEAATYLRPGAIVLGHANYPTAVRNFTEIRRMIDERGLQPRTLNEMFGTPGR